MQQLPDTDSINSTPDWRQRAMLVVLNLAQFMTILDVTVVNVALPQISGSLGLDRASLTWVVTSYTLAAACLLILGGRLADVVGRQRIFLVGLGLFTAASLTSGLATGGAMLVSSRLVQGIGAALMSPAALSILTTELSGRERTRALAVWAAVGGAGAAVGVMLGGLLTAGPGWQWAFLVNVPIGLAVGLTVAWVVPSRPGRRGVRIDLPGTLTGTATVALLIYALIGAGDTGWGSDPVLVSLGLAGLGALAFAVVERHTEQPLIPAALLRRTALPGALALMLAASALLMLGFFLTSLYLQQVRAFGPLGTGLAFLPVALATIAGARIAVGFGAHVRPRVIAAAALLLAAAGFALMSWTGGAALTTLLPGFVLVALGVGIVIVTATTSGLSRVDPAVAGVASGILTTTHELGLTAGVAIASTLAAPAISGLLPDPAAGFGQAFLIAAAAAVVLSAGAARLLPAGQDAAAPGSPSSPATPRH